MLAPRDAGSQRDPGEAITANTLDSLKEQFPLPAGAASPSVFTEAADILGSTIHLAGIASNLGKEVICGSAASLDELPLDRAYFELLERLSVVAAMARAPAAFPVRDTQGNRLGEIPGARLFASPSPEGPDWRPARSNGVAIGPSWESASRSAHWELLERDRVLRSWYGDLTPRSVAAPDLQARLPARAAETYDVEVYELGSDRDGVVAGVFAFPRGEEPLAYGFAARSSRAAAVSAAASECVQRLGFLWGEPVPTSNPEPIPGPDYHQELYLVPANHPVLRGWLRGEHARYRGSLGDPEGAAALCVGAPDALPCADLTPPELVGRLHVAKAIGPQRVPLVFGRGHPWLVRGHAPVPVHPVA